jgi:hypothetical protein
MSEKYARGITREGKVKTADMVNWKPLSILSELLMKLITPHYIAAVHMFACPGFQLA